MLREHDRRFDKELKKHDSNDAVLFEQRRIALQFFPCML